MFTALTFNMQNGEAWKDDESGNPTPPNLEGTAEFLRAVNADVVMLQEVEAGHDGGCQLQPPPNFTRLRQLLPYPHSFFSYPPDNPDELPFGLGLAIFSKFPLSEERGEILEAADVRFEYGGRLRQPSQRLLISAVAEIQGRAVRLLNTHLQAYFMIGTSSGEHPEQRRRVLEILKRAGPRALLAGDFNTEPGDGLLEEFEAAGFPPAQKAAPTWKRRPYAVDHFFHGPGLRISSCQVVPTATSDHDAVRVAVEFVA